MQIRDFINNVCNEIKYKPVQKGIADELENHMQELKEDFKAEGLADDIAEDNVVAEMGDAKLIGKSLNKIHKPKLDWKLIILIVDFNKFGADKSCFSTKEPRAADYGERAKLNQIRIASQQLLRKGGKRTDERFY